MSYDELQESTGVPADILGRSAEARAEADGKTEEQVVADWTGEEASTPAAAKPAEPPESVEAVLAADPAALPIAESLTGEALVAAAAEAKGLPASLVERSAQARADADGVPVEDVMRGWVIEAGLADGGAAPAPMAPVPETEAAPPPAAAPEPAAPAEEAELGVEVLEPVESIEDVSVEEQVPARTGRYPAWLAASLVIIPLLAVFYVMVVPDQPSCGSAGQVGVDPATGIHANCDGSAYGAQEEDNVLLGAEIYSASCAVCHGDAGQGGAGPALAGGAVLETFPEGSCDSHIEWVTLGSAGWPDDTYGAQSKPVQGGMPAMELTLSEEQIAQVTLYERVELGGADEPAAETDCGLGEAEEVEAATG
jgi:mono/diheme cytochrome c family protein